MFRATCSILLLPFLQACLGGSAATCNDLINDGPEVHPTRVAQATPAATGGTLVKGTYVLTAYAEYVGPTGTAETSTDVIKEKAVYEDTTINFVVKMPGSSDEHRTYNYTVDTTNFRLEQTGNCGGEGSTSTPYSVSGNTLITYHGTSKQIALTWTRQ